MEVSKEMLFKTLFDDPPNHINRHAWEAVVMVLRERIDDLFNRNEAYSGQFAPYMRIMRYHGNPVSDLVKDSSGLPFKFPLDTSSKPTN